MSPAVWVLATLVVFVAAFVQASVGIGFAMLAAPLLLLLDADLAPAPVLLAMLVLATLMAGRCRDDIDAAGLSALLPGLATGTLLAVAATPALPTSSARVTGAIVLLAAVVSATGLGVPRGRSASFIVGLVAGATGTVSGVHGPALALAYRQRPVAVARATIAAVFVVASSASLAALWWTGRLGASGVGHGLALVPGTLAGWFAASLQRLRLPELLVRALVLGLVFVSGAILLLGG